VRNGCGNRYLSKGMAIESEVADTKGSTATTALLIVFGVIHKSGQDLRGS
jgi:hypothetical protein